MNGFFIIAEISGLQQFLKVDNSSASEMIANCSRSINNSHRSELFQQGAFLIFPIESEKEKAGDVAESAIALLEVISSYSEEIHEFSMMLIHRKNSSPASVAADFRQKFFSDSEDYALLIEKTVAEAAGYKTDDDYFVVRIEEDEADRKDPDSPDRLIMRADVDRLLRMLVPFIDAEVEQRVFILTGGPELAVRLNLQQAVKDASGENRSPALLHVDIMENESSVIMPFARCIDRQLLPVVEDHLEGVELKTWMSIKSRIDTINADFPEEYFFSVFSLYLKGIMKFFKSALQPPVIVFSGVNEGSKEFIRYAQRILNYIEEDINPFIFFINDGSTEIVSTLFSDGLFRYYSTRACCTSVNTPEPYSKLNYRNSRLLYILRLTEGLFNGDMLEQFLAECGYNSGEISTGLTELENIGCIINGQYIRIVRGDDFAKITNRVADKPDIHGLLAGFVENNIFNRDLYDYGLAASRLSEYSSDQAVGSAVYSCLTALLNFNRVAEVRKLLSENKNLDRVMDDALMLRCAMLENDKASCLEILKNVPEHPESPGTMNDALLQLEAARYFHSIRDYQRALDYVKKVLIFLQAGDYPRLEGIAFIELGFLMLCKGKLLESAEYLSLAVERLAGTGDLYSRMKAQVFSAVQHYIWGALDESLEAAERARAIAEGNGYGEWLFYTEFLICRLYFELGRYYDAEKKLSECLLRSEVYPNPARKRIFSAWTARACVYQGKIYRGINMLLSLDEDPEILFFLAEAYFFNGNMEKAVESVERAGSPDDYFKLDFSPLEYISWINGFSPVEDRLLQSAKGTGVLYHNVRAMHAYLLGLTGNREYGSELLFSLTRDEKISEIDPFNRLYFFFYCQMIEHRQNAEIIDKLTLISKALKYLQQTSSRITDPKVRQQYMNKNYWNARLVSEAQKEKLI